MSSKKQKGTTADYEVGRGKPPKQHRFKPGQSGNPGGRKKGSRNLRTVLEDTAHMEIEISEGGRTRRVSLIEGLALKLAQAGLGGNVRAIDLFLEHYSRTVDQKDNAIEETSEEDNALLERLFGSRLEQGTSIVTPAVPDTDDEEEGLYHE
jgi:hypothetical protein